MKHRTRCKTSRGTVFAALSLFAALALLGTLSGACDSSGVAPSLGASIDDGATADAGAIAIDAGVIDSGVWKSADHEPFPRVTSAGGPVLAHADIVTIAFGGDAHESLVNEYVSWIVTSSWLSLVGKDYGVGAGTHSTHVVLTESAPSVAKTEDTQALLVRLMAAGTLPKPGPDTLFFVLYPATTTVSNFEGRPNCAVGPSGEPTVGGYHWEHTIDGNRFPFVVLPTCSSGMNAQIYMEASASHEIIEAATDPFPVTAPGYGLANLQSGWSALVGEVADLCQLLTWTNYGGHWVHPSWSSSAALSGGNPCVPQAAMDPYYNASLTPSDVLHVRAGDSVTLKVRGWSTAPMKRWSLSASAYGDFEPTLSLSQSSINNGESATLTIRVPPGQKPGATASVLLMSTRSMPNRDFNYWPTSVIVSP